MTRRLLAHPVIFFLLGVLFAQQLPGEPFRSRLFLAVLVALAVVAGVAFEGTRRGGSVELHNRLAALEPAHVVVTLDVDGYRPGELPQAVADGAIVLSRGRR